jgi:hypothetical protein
MATTKANENFLRTGEVSLKGFQTGHAEYFTKNGRAKGMYLYKTTFHVTAFRLGAEDMVSKEFNIEELTKARRFYRSIRFFKTHSSWSQE